MRASVALMFPPYSTVPQNSFVFISVASILPSLPQATLAAHALLAVYFHFHAQGQLEATAG